jgi:hypothetical protein
VVNKTWEASQKRLNALSAEQKMDLQIAWTRQHEDGHRIKVLEQNEDGHHIKVLEQMVKE